ncbi:MAG: ABC transporter ATP-binding protein [Candidatus Microsaccharimonas sp.]
MDIPKPAVVVKNVSKTFRIPLDKSSGIKQVIVNIGKRKKGYRNFKVLDDISFEINQGEFFGIVGRNGSGKSTLLKILAGIYVPDKGLVQINGSLTPFIELGVGFNPELSGKENVYLNGALLGFSRREVDEIYDEIVEFAELGDFMAEKLKNFSSGMQVRLAFSIAIRARSQILIMDEVLAVGDADFQKKCFDVFRELKKEGRTIILVTHDMSNVERFCDRVLIVDKGSPLSVTTPSKAASLYARLNIDDSNVEDKSNTNRWGVGGIKIKNLSINDTDKRKSPILNFEDSFKLDIDLITEKEYLGKTFDIGLAFINQDNITVTGPNSAYENFSGKRKVTYVVDKLPLQPGNYKVTVAVVDKENGDFLDFYDRAISFHVISDKPAQGVVAVSGIWSAE